MVTKAGRRLDAGGFPSSREVQAFYHWIIHACQTKLNKPEAQLQSMLLSHLRIVWYRPSYEAARWFATRMEKSGYKANAGPPSIAHLRLTAPAASHPHRHIGPVVAAREARLQVVTFNCMIGSCIKNGSWAPKMSFFPVVAPKAPLL